jgi:hypothetical protein
MVLKLLLDHHHHPSHCHHPHPPFRPPPPFASQVFGENMAILSGDALLVYAFEHIARDTKGVSPERVVKVVIELARASGADGLVGGQVVDIQSEDKEVRGLGGGLKVCVWGGGEGGGGVESVCGGGGGNGGGRGALPLMYVWQR